MIKLVFREEGTDPESEPVPEWARVARVCKRLAVECGPHAATGGHMPPVVYCPGPGRVQAYLAPEVQREQGLAALLSLRLTEPDRPLVIAFDMFGRRQEVPRALAPGRLQEDYQGGDTTVIQIVTAFRLQANDTVEPCGMPYIYSGPGTPFAWLDSHRAPESEIFGGELVQMIRDMNRVAAEARRRLRARHRTPAHCRHFLKSNGYTIVYLTPSDPDPDPAGL